jgi:glucosamine--fructose-6-phosphate aminotransferase (isomerizing)
MCGIVGYAGHRQAATVLLDGLEKLEYRGYDSAGVCVHNENGLSAVKAKGRLQVLRDRLDGGNGLPGVVGIGHTRWATHGAPSDVNSHPHLSWTGKIAVVHNGIIENEARLREKLLRKGATFYSETDTEVVSNLVGYYYEKYGNFVKAVREAVFRLEGSFALGIMCIDEPGKIIAVKKDSPLIFGFGEGENFIASDVPAILKYTQTVAYMEDGDMVIFDADNVTFMDISGDVIEKKREKIT